MTLDEKTQEKLALKIAQAELESARWQAYFEEEVETHAETKKELQEVRQELADFNSVLDSDADLKELFDEIKGKLGGK